MKKLQTEFIQKQKEVTAEHYDEMLGAVPPKRMASNAFLVGEASDHAIVPSENAKLMQARYEMYFIENDHYYYAGLSTVRGFEMFLVPQN